MTVVLIVCGVGSGVSRMAAASGEGRMTAAGAAPALSIVRLDYAVDGVKVEFVSPQPTGRHELQESTDLTQWQAVPSAAIEVMGGNNLRASAVGPAAALRFYRVQLSSGSSTNDPVYVNVQVDAELEDVQGIRNVIGELTRRGIPTTVYVTAEYANRNAMYITELFNQGFEIALHGYYTGEQLASMTYAEQKDLLSRAKVALEGCRPCGTYKPIIGFRPQYFSQNEDTYRVLDELGMTYNSGYKVGQIFFPGHEWDSWPYLATGHQFHVLPIATIPTSEDRVYLCDIACAQVLHWTGAQWREALLQSLAQSLQSRQPLVVLLHGYYTGDQTKYDYWQPFVDFLDAAKDKVTFVTSKRLVELAQ